MYCPECGAATEADARFCPECGRQMPGRAAVKTQRQPEAGAPIYASPEHSAAAGYPVGDQGAPRNSAWPLPVAAALVLAGLVVGGWWLMNRGQEPATQPVTAVSTPTTQAETPNTPGATPTSASPTAPSVAQQTVFVAPPQTVTVMPQPERTVYVAPEPERDSRYVQENDQWAGLHGSWVTVLDSIPKNNMSRASARARAATLERSGAPKPFVLDSSQTPGLNSGYWAIVVGHYATESAARSACGQLGRPVGGSCYPRQIL